MKTTHLPNRTTNLNWILRGSALLAVMLFHGGRYIFTTALAAKLFTYATVPGWSGVELFFV